MIHHIRFTAERIAQRILLIEPLVYQQKILLSPFTYRRLEGPGHFPPLKPMLEHNSKLVHTDQEWVDWRENFSLQTQFLIPLDWLTDIQLDGRRSAALYLPLGDSGDFCHPEALIYVDGYPYAACDRQHQEVACPIAWLDGLSHSLVLIGWSGLGGDVVNPRNARLKMQPCYLVLVNQGLREFITLAKISLKSSEILEINHPSKDGILNALDSAFNVLDTREPLGDNLMNSVAEADQVLRNGLKIAGNSMPIEVVAAGHAHIDVAWLWTLGQTRQKAGRTFHNMLRLMERYPKFHFTQSQPQLYEFVRQDFPDLFRQIQERVAMQQWELIGGMWVEADCNLSGPESLVRQFLLGRIFFRDYFGSGSDSPVLWLPDVFGYAWNLPQLILESGLNYFFTIKIGWSQYNRLPYDTFWWQGLDGSKVLTHFSTSPDPGSYASTYNAMASPAEALGTWVNFQQKELRQPLLMAYGFGDGGGGPTAEMIENIEIMSEFPGLPRMRQGSVGNFFQEVEKSVGDQLPVWNGELYLELHRGTYTTQARIKKANRVSEFLLHDAEFITTIAWLIEPTYGYPAEALQSAWKLVCLNQFHDIIPGSSIGDVYLEALEQYSEIQFLADTIRNDALQAIARNFGVDSLIVNPTGTVRTDPVYLSVKDFVTGDGSGSQIQKSNGYVNLGSIAPYSISPTSLKSEIKVEDSFCVNGGLLEPGNSGGGVYFLQNAFLRVEFTQSGEICRLSDLAAKREIIPTGSLANVFQAFEDRPLNWDAWDIDIFYEDRVWLADPADSIGFSENSPLRCTLEVKKRILHSTITQQITLSHHSPRLDFVTEINWLEKHTLLKVAFPVDILSPVATYEIQWGNVQRPTHRNTSWDWARFETAAQKWVDLSEGGYGVSMLNNGKYGHDIRDNVIRMTLLRSPTNPDPSADQGSHFFTYSIYPHKGGWDQRTVNEAYALNDPIILWSMSKAEILSQTQARLMPDDYSFVTCSEPNVLIETIKRAENGGGVILRMYEFQRIRGTCKLVFNLPVSQVWRTNILEENQFEFRCAGKEVDVQYRPYEIISIRVVFAGYPGNNDA